MSGAKSIEDLMGGGDEETRQPLDIAKEMFTGEDKMTKSNLSGKDVAILARALWFGNRYRIRDIPNFVDKILLMRRSEKGLVIKMFGKVLEGMQPRLEQKEGGELKV